jgi:hypothetical protein
MEGPSAQAGVEEGAALLDAFIFKETSSNGELVVRRKLVLYASKFTTYHDWEVSAASPCCRSQ